MRVYTTGSINFRSFPHFLHKTKIENKLRTLSDMGLGYLTLGEATPSLSGGEAQRLKLASEIGKSQKNSIFIFDEPTIGLHPLDVKVLIDVFDNLIDRGATVIVIEHDLDLIKNADYIVDMGPGGGLNGGEIVVKGDNVMLGYYNDPEQTAQVLNNGWFRTGDYGYIDEKGFIYITGRKKNVIVLQGGKNVFPEEIEEYLEVIDTISECCVIGRKSEGSDEVVLTAVIYPDYSKFPANVDEETVKDTIKKAINATNKKLPTYKQIKAIDIRKTEFEKTTTKKIKRQLVK